MQDVLQREGRHLTQTHPAEGATLVEPAWTEPAGGWPSAWGWGRTGAMRMRTSKKGHSVSWG